MTKFDAERRLSDLRMDDMPVVEFRPVSSPVPADWFTRLKKVRREFMESLSDAISELSFLNLSQDAFMGLLMGRALPENLSLRWRKPITMGGEIMAENLFACPRFPYGHNLDRFILEQSGGDVLFLPAPEKKIYVPAHMLGGGDGGNATSDRLSEIAAQLAAEQGRI